MKTTSRWEKMEREKESYPRDFPGRVSVQDCLIAHTLDNKRTEPIKYIHGNVIKIAGRIMSRRDHGNNIFFDLMDQTGTIQLHAIMPKDNDWQEPGGDPTCNAIRNCDLGDMVGVEGTIGANPRGEPLLQISNWTLLAKALREPPDKFHGITDDGTRYRHRERELLGSREARELFKTRSEIVFEIRKYLNDRDYVEIECPILQNVYGGATAEPFVTRHKALGQDYFLAISSELYLKRALVGGFDRVYSVGRCFRNEGISTTHNPEFTNVEFFATCETADSMRKLTEDMIEHTAHSVGSLIPPLEFHNNLPAVDWPLSRRLSTPMNPDNVPKNPHEYADAWELFAGNMEIASGASDLNNPVEQRERFEENSTAHDPLDENYIEALEQGALPWAGVGIGIDRLVMLLTNKTNIRDVILFPTLKG